MSDPTVRLHGHVTVSFRHKPRDLAQKYTYEKITRIMVDVTWAVKSKNVICALIVLCKLSTENKIVNLSFIPTPHTAPLPINGSNYGIHNRNTSL